MNYDKCTIATRDSTVVLKENRSKFEIHNKAKQKIHKIKVDGCLIGNEHEKCDWIVTTEDADKKRALFIELKGCQLDKAISQLRTTLQLTAERFKHHEKECYAVTTRVPKHGTSVRKLALDFFNKTNSPLSVKNEICSIHL
ncbi:hypothetical protein G7045_07080 [Acidovorax sp. HDW3]|uniref:hypothetical protein n=1 Tax=Acidovorax sp. HDW3 TaxID=2714923 RepID=UPI001407367B|nr:hypothetical protein [Acidovorax sp. HDW3]QIL44048.1 hypothetical protein G7045_07080 [Acidovorax sp. HDW3]